MGNDKRKRGDGDVMEKEEATWGWERRIVKKRKCPSLSPL